MTVREVRKITMEDASQIDKRRSVANSTEFAVRKFDIGRTRTMQRLATIFTLTTAMTTYRLGI